MMFPEFRLGFMVVPESLIETLSLAKYYTDTRSAYLEQAALALFIKEGHYARHVRKVRKACQERQQALIAAIQQFLADVLTVQPTDLRDSCDLLAKCPMGLSKALLTSVLPFIWLFSLYPATVNNLMKKLRYCFGYAAHTPDEISMNIQKLAQQIKHK